MQAEKSHFGSQGEYVREKYSLFPPPPSPEFTYLWKKYLKFMNSLSFSYKQSKIIVGISSAISFTNRSTFHWYILSLLL